METNSVYTVSDLLQALKDCAPNARVYLHQYRVGVPAVSLVGISSNGERVVLS